ncbi:MAG: GTP-binding protein [Methylococcaceae bacterium]|nr:GTP-binding protein [Methylococcaceae bacterium]
MGPKRTERIPVILVSGFLGSGKTTLLNQLLKDNPRSAVVINEFGTTPIDQQILRDHDILLSVLSGGCLCCQMRDTLIPVLKNLRMTWENTKSAPPLVVDSNQPPSFDRIIIETSGIANPVVVMDILLHHHWLSRRLQLQTLITTVSAVTNEQYFEDFPEMFAQIAWADLLAITQSDLATTLQIDRLQARLDQFVPATPRITATHGNIESSSLLATHMPFRSNKIFDCQALPEHFFRSDTVHLDFAVSWSCLENALQAIIKRYPEQIIRIKGMVYTHESSEPLLVQGSSERLYPPTRLPTRKADDGIGRLVFICRSEISTLTEEVITAMGKCK